MTHPTILKLIETGIPLSNAQFHAAVNNANKVPENYFSDKSLNSSRRAEMWAHPMWNFILCRQKNVEKKDCYFMVPVATVIFAHFSDYQDVSVAHLDINNEELESILAKAPKMGKIVPLDDNTLQPGHTYKANLDVSTGLLTQEVIAPKKRGRPFKNQN